MSACKRLKPRCGGRFHLTAHVIARSALAVGCVALMACASAEPVAQQAYVRFVVDAPLCSAAIPVQFSVDRVMVGTDTFRVDLPPNHTESVAFDVAAGRHVLGAKTFGAFVHVWRDTVITAKPGVTATDTLPFYCS